MKSKHFLVLFAAGSAAVTGFLSCKRIPDPVNMLEPKKDVFAVNYNLTTPAPADVSYMNIDSKKAAIGRLLFYDNRLSLNGTVNCGSCHIQNKNFSDGQAESVGFMKGKTHRTSMAILNIDDINLTARGKLKFFWDGRAAKLADMVLAPSKNHVEMGMESGENIVKAIRNVEYYKDGFNKVGFEINEENISACLAEFVRSLQSFNSRFDQGIRQSGVQTTNIATTTFPNFTEQENIGKHLFFVNYNCVNCHGLSSKIPQKTSSYNNDSRALMMNIGLDADGENTNETATMFKAPTLRNIALTAPYMHDGRLKDLNAVIKHYSEGIKMNANLSSELVEFKIINGQSVKVAHQFNINETEAAALVAFLNTLTDDSFITDSRFSNPYLP